MKKLIFVLSLLLAFNCSSDDSSPENNEDNTCPMPFNTYVYNLSDSNASVEWSINGGGNNNIASFDIEYGVSGFSLGTGTTYSTSNYHYEMSNLSTSTQYDFYVKSNCSNNVSSEFSGPVTFSTESACSKPSSLNFYSLESCSFQVSWNTAGETAWEIEYGEVGFTIGNGTVVNTSDTYFNLTENITPNTTYEVYVRANCGSDGFSEYTDALVVTTNQLHPNYIGEWTITMSDSFGDGWQGDGIKITVNDQISYATVPEGAGQFANTQTVNVPSNTSVLIFEFTGDEYPEEVSYELFNPNGNSVNSDSNPPVGIIFSHEDICN